MEWKRELANIRIGFLTVQQRRAVEARRLLVMRERMVGIEAEKIQLLKVVVLIDKTIELISANGIQQIESIVSGGLRLVLDDPRVGLDIEKHETARGNSYELIPYRGRTRGKALETFGGSVSNVIAFLLRVIMIRRFGLAKFLFIDESFNGVAAVYQPMVSSMLHSLCADHGFTVFAITHQPILAAAADHVYRLTPGSQEETDGPTLKHLDASEMAELQVWSERAAAGF